MKKVHNIMWGVFPYTKFWLNFKEIPLVFKRILFTLKHGYAPQAQWETFAWFTDVMKEILIWYRDHRMGSPIVIDNYFDNPNCETENEAAWNKIIDTMIDCLNKMDESNSIYDNMGWREQDKLMRTAKDEFFKLFSQYFYTLWD